MNLGAPSALALRWPFGPWHHARYCQGLRALTPRSLPSSAMLATAMPQTTPGTAPWTPLGRLMLSYLARKLPALILIRLL